MHTTNPTPTYTWTINTTANWGRGMQALSFFALVLLSASGSIFADDTDGGIFTYPGEDAEIQTIREGEPFRAAIPIRNNYDRAIRIARFDSTCACNVLRTDSDFLIPGEETTLHFEVDTDNLSGRARQTVWMYLSDPGFDPLQVTIQWNIRPLVAVDALPPDQQDIHRPEDSLWRDIYRVESHERPENAGRLQKNLLVSTPPEETPEGGLEVTQITYEGSIWQFVIRQVDEHRSLVLLRAKDPDAELPQGTFEETFTIHTNHPIKHTIVMESGVKVDPDAGREVQNPLIGGPPPMPR
ncbi:MAG: DUF1573 domain-containing protein [Planctomycetota bacterium]|nr:MAG: DUF1573 domain-containing protein [Planctomycetota bacterium]